MVRESKATGLGGQELAEARREDPHRRRAYHYDAAVAWCVPVLNLDLLGVNNACGPREFAIRLAPLALLLITITK